MFTKSHGALIITGFVLVIMFSMAGAYASPKSETVKPANGGNEVVSHKTLYDLPTSNGYAAAVYNTRQHKVVGLYEHIYKNYNESIVTKNFLKDAHFVVSVNGYNYDLSQINEADISYIPGTGIIKAVYDFGFEAYYFAPMLYNGHGFVMVGRFTNPVQKSKIKLEYNDDIQGIKDHEKAILTEQSIKDENGNEVQKTVFFMLPEGELSNAHKSVMDNDILSAELNWWQDWHKKSRVPVGLDKKNQDLYMQSLAVLKMAQCREPGQANGQILASLPPGMWNIAWVRDGAYSIAALAESGHLQEAKAGLEFMLNADANYYEHYLHTDGKDYGIKKPYQISVCRYFGVGREESDFNDCGPNIELDGFGMFLWALQVYVQQSGDTAFVKQYWNVLSKKVADVLVFSIDDSGLIRAESGPWERHLPGKHFTYTSVFATQGLKSAASLAKLLGNNEQSIAYSRAAEKLKAMINSRLIDKHGVIKGNLEGENQLDYDYYNGEAIEAYNFNIIDKNIARNTIKAFDENLRIKTRDNGYYRVSNSKDWYDCQEWVIIDLRTAVALQKMGAKDQADKLLNWVVEQSAANYNLFAELYDETTADYQGAVPMCGFGAGAYILAVQK